MKYILKHKLFFIILLLLLCYFSYSFIGIPSQPPKLTIKYNNKPLPSTSGDTNWLGKDGGNTNLVGNSYEVVVDKAPISIKPNETIEIKFSRAPKKVRIIQWLNSKNTLDLYEDTNEKRTYKYTMPKQSGEYIFEILGDWDDRHNLSEIIKVKIE